MKKITLLLFVLVLIAASGFGLYVFLFSTEPVTINSLKAILPFGGNKIPTGGIADQTPDTNASTTDSSNQPVAIDLENSPVPILRKVSAEPVSGFTTFYRTYTEIVDGKKVTKTETPIRYIERGTGNIFETKTDSLVWKRLTNTTYPRIQEAFFTNKGNSVVLRSLGDIDEIRTYVADIVPAKADEQASSTTEVLGTLSGYYIDDNISFVEISPDTTKMLLIREDVNGTNIQVSDVKGNKPKSIFNSSLNEWLAQWYAPDAVAVTTKPSSGVSGITDTLNPATGSVKPLISAVAGLTTLVSPKGDALYNQSEGGSLSMAYYNKKDGTYTSLNKATLAEKCVWSAKQTNIVYCLIPNNLNSATYPDAWYQGTVSFSDSVWMFNTTTKEFTNITDTTKTVAAGIDGIRPSLSPDENYLLFINKKDGSLWSLRIE